MFRFYNITKTFPSSDAKLVSEPESDANLTLVILVDCPTDGISVLLPAALSEAMNTNINNCEIFNKIERLFSTLFNNKEL